MRILLLLAWRNIWRHPGRSGALLAAVTAGLWAGVLTIGAMNGMLRQRVDYLINNELTHVQVHHPQFLADGYAWQALPQPEALRAWLEQDPRVRNYSLRTLTDGMLQSPVKTSGVRIRGIDQQAEARTTSFHHLLVAGEDLDAAVRNPLVMGKSLAKAHNITIGTRVVLLFEDRNGELVAAAFNLVGLYESAAGQYDKRHVLVRSADLMALLAGEPIYHEIAMMLHDEQAAAGVSTAINERFPQSRAQTWSELSPELRTLVDYSSFMLLIITGIIMLALAFGILNTMLMAIFERLREIGMLLCVGMSRRRVLLMILLESLLLTLSGALAGVILAGLSIAWLGRRGIDLEIFASGLAEIGYDRIIYPFLTPSEFINVILVVIGVTLLASIYPAIRAVRIDPVTAAKTR
ncbi:MAG: FtsX-like permease family protein [Pelovirga sp.]